MFSGFCPKLHGFNLLSPSMDVISNRCRSAFEHRNFVLWKILIHSACRKNTKIGQSLSDVVNIWFHIFMKRSVALSRGYGIFITSPAISKSTAPSPPPQNPKGLAIDLLDFIGSLAQYLHSLQSMAAAPADTSAASGSKVKHAEMALQALANVIQNNPGQCHTAGRLRWGTLRRWSVLRSFVNSIGMGICVPPPQKKNTERVLYASSPGVQNPARKLRRCIN